MQIYKEDSYVRKGEKDFSCNCQFAVSSLSWLPVAIEGETRLRFIRSFSILIAVTSSQSVDVHHSMMVPQYLFWPYTDWNILPMYLLMVYGRLILARRGEHCPCTLKHLQIWYEFSFHNLGNFRVKFDWNLSIFCFLYKKVSDIKKINIVLL